MARFYVEGRITLSVGVEITAKDLDAAVERTKAMKLEDFVDIHGDHNDSNFEIAGVNKSGGAPKL